MLAVAMTTRRSGSTAPSRAAVSGSHTAAATAMTTGSARRLSARERVWSNGNCSSKVRSVRDVCLTSDRLHRVYACACMHMYTHTDSNTHARWGVKDCKQT